MRRFLIFALILILNIVTIAQDESIRMPDNLPEPILTDEIIENIYFADVTQFAWIDDETLIFAPYVEYTATSDGELHSGYQYDLNSNSLIPLLYNPVRANLTDEEKAFYQVAEGATVFQSPYPLANNAHNIMYSSTVRTDCGGVCILIMQGTYRATMNDEYDGYSHQYYPSGFYNWAGFGMLWGQDNNSAVITIGGTSSISFSYFQFDGGIRVGIPSFRIIDYAYDRLLGISPDGSRVAFASHWDDIGAELADHSFQRLFIWDAPYHDEHCSCTYDAQVHVIEPALRQENIGNYLAGVGFVDEDTILYIGELGLMRHNLLTGISSIIDPELNVGWIRTAIFSPDNQHVAITTEQGLYVLSLFAP